MRPDEITFNNLGSGNWRIDINGTSDSVTFSSNDNQTITIYDTSDGWYYQWNGSDFGTAIDF